MGITTGVITLAVADNAGGGGQSAFTSAYASIGSLGGKVQRSTNTVLQAGQGFNDLNWATDFIVNGPPGSTVSFQFSHSLDGFTAAAGQGYSGDVHSTIFVGADILGDFDFNLLINPGPFSVLLSRVYTFNAGDTVRLVGRMTVGGRADRFATVDINAFNTSMLYVDVLTQGGGYTTDAGVVFPTLASVPEPATWSLVLFGAVLVIAGRGVARRSVTRRREEAFL
ncbi:MAG: PEP-CTERM sorting domain-containing protein [Acidobacteria bacterium]|nr:PEP-CTERM sorting domain-containing protein [Acidobacteriota bacterium]